MNVFDPVVVFLDQLKSISAARYQMGNIRAESNISKREQFVDLLRALNDTAQMPDDNWESFHIF